MGKVNLESVTVQADKNQLNAKRKHDGGLKFLSIQHILDVNSEGFKTIITSCFEWIFHCLTLRMRFSSIFFSNEGALSIFVDVENILYTVLSH